MADPSLQDLASQASQDPNNSWLSPVNPDLAGPPSPVNIPAPSTGGGMSLDPLASLPDNGVSSASGSTNAAPPAPPPPTGLTQAQIDAAKTLHELPPNFNSLNEDTQKRLVAITKNQASTLGMQTGSPATPSTSPATSGQPNVAAGPVVPPTAAAKKAANGGVAGATPYVSPERAALNRQLGIDNQRIGLLDRDTATAAEVKRLGEVGQFAGLQAQKSADAQHILNQSQLQSMTRDIEDRSNRRDIERERQADEVRAMKVDPNHWYKKVGVAGSIGAAISIGLGAFGAAMPHTTNHTNYALDIINKAIEGDVDAQKYDIEKKWKALDYQGSEDQKKYVKDQFSLNQRREAMMTNYSHALAQVQQVKQNTTDAQGIANLDTIATGIQQNVLNVKKDQSDAMLRVAQQERAQAAAAYAATPMAKYLKYAEEVDKGNAGHPDKPVAKMDYDTFKKQNYGGAGGEAPDATGPNKGKSADTQSGLNALTKTGDKAVNAASIGTALSARLPRLIAEQGNIHQDEINQYRSDVRGALKQVEPRLTTDELDIQEKPFIIDNAMPIATRKQHLQAFINRVSTGLALKEKYNTGAAPGVEGAEPVGE